MRKIAFISGGFGPLSPEMKRRHGVLQAAASSDTQIDMYGGKGSIESRVGEYKGTGKFGAVETEYGLSYGFPRSAKVCIEAFAIFEAVSVPVVGPGTTARHVCSLVSHKFTLLTTGKHGPVYHMMEHENPHGLGRWVSTRTIGLGVLDVREQPEEAYEAMVREAKIAMAKDGADAFTYGCMSMAFMDIDKKLEDELGVPFINPAKVAVKMAEMYVDLGIAHNKITFARPARLRFR